MTTKTLRTSGGDFSTLQQVFDFFSNIFGTLDDDYGIEIQGGTTWGATDARKCVSGDSQNFQDYGGFRVHFYTKSSELVSSGPAKLLGFWFLASSTPGDTGGLKFSQLRLGFDADDGAFNKPFYVGGGMETDIQVERCEIAVHHPTDSGGTTITLTDVDATSTVNAVSFKDVTFIFSNSDVNGITGINNVGGSAPRVLMDNCLFLLHSALDTAVVINGKAANHNNKVFNYGVGTPTIAFGSGTGSVVNNAVITNPNLVQAALATEGDSVATILTKDLNLQASSTQVIDAGYDTSAIFPDLGGTAALTGSHVDVGAYEYVSATPTPDIEIFLETITSGYPVQVYTSNGHVPIKIGHIIHDISTITIDLGKYHSVQQILNSYQLRSAINEGLILIQSGVITPSISRQS